MKTLRARLIFIQVIPWLLITPLIGLTLWGLLETQEILTQLSTKLEQQAFQVARLAEMQPEIFASDSQAELFIDVQYTEAGIDPTIQLTLLTPNGDVLGTNLVADPAEVERQLALPSGAISEIETRGYFQIQNNLALMLVPVADIQDQVLGLVAASKTVGQSTDRLPLMRNLLLVALIGELVLGIILGFGLSRSLRRDLRILTDALDKINAATAPELLPEQGPEEIKGLIVAYNTTVERLYAAEETRRQLLANIVHELGRPLGAMHAAVQALLRGGHEDETFRKELLAGMASQIERLQPLLDNLTQLHGQIPGGLEIKPKPTDLSQWLPEVIAPWQAAAQAKGLQWQTDIPATLPTIDIDPDRLAQATGNLLSNAVKYTPANGKVMLVVTGGDNSVRISVRDTGPGIEPAEREKIFEPFYRSSRETRFPQGMGLGLSIAREIVEAHGGTIRLESKLDLGSTFEIEIPTTS